MKISLYYMAGSCSLAPHILLREVGVPHDLVEVTDADSASYHLVNPKGFVPALDVDGQILTEGPAIVWFIGGLGDGSMLPQAGMPAARTLEWFNYLSGWVHSVAFASLLAPGRFTSSEECWPGIQSSGRSKVMDSYSKIDGLLSAADYATGDRYGPVDPYLFAFFRWGLRLGFAMRAEFPHYTRHAELVWKRPAVREAVALERVKVWEA